jgi:hypothetical protein
LAAVLRVDDAVEELPGRLDRARLVAEDPVRLVRPAQWLGVAAEIPFPAADVRRRLRVLEYVLAPPQCLLGRTDLGDVVDQRGEPDDAPVGVATGDVLCPNGAGGPTS